MRIVEAVTVHVDLDPWLSLSGLAGYSGLSVRALRGLLRGPDGIPHFRLGSLDRRAGCRGNKIVVRRSEYDHWAERWRVVQAQPPRDLGEVLAQAVASVKGANLSAVDGRRGPNAKKTKGAPSGGGAGSRAGVADERA